MPKKIYISGPMTGYPDDNYAAFYRAEETLRLAGHTVSNPARNYDGEHGLPYADYFRIDVQNLLDVDAVAVLPGWRESVGAKREVGIARLLNLPILDIETMEPVETLEESVCEEADRIVQFDRGQAYGHPYDNFLDTAKLWEPIIGTLLTPEQVALCMIQIKLARELHQHKRDNGVDICGYAKCLQMVAEERERREAAQSEKVGMVRALQLFRGVDDELAS